MKISSRRGPMLGVGMLMLTLVTATANAKVYPLEKLPDERIKALAPLLAQGDVALIESKPDGMMKQVTLLLFVRATPETVHDVTATPEKYGKFLDLSKNEVKRRDDGTIYHSWQLDLPVSSFDAQNIYVIDPGPTGAVQVQSFKEVDEATYRWEFLPVQGGSILVMYGYTDIKRSGNFVRQFIRKQSVMEHGLAMSAQLLLAAGIRKESERRQPRGSLGPLPSGRVPSVDFLLARGVVAVTRSTPEGKFGEVSLLDRVYASASKIREIIAQPGDYGSFIPGVEAHEKKRDESGVVYSVEFSVPILSWTSKFEMHLVGGAIDGFCIEGDFRDGRYRWDLTVRSPKETLVGFRFAQSLGQGSIIARNLFKAVPSLEYGLNVAYGLVYLRGVRAQAEGWAK